MERLKQQKAFLHGLKKVPLIMGLVGYFSYSSFGSRNIVQSVDQGHIGNMGMIAFGVQCKLLQWFDTCTVAKLKQA